MSYCRSLDGHIVLMIDDILPMEAGTEKRPPIKLVVWAVLFWVSTGLLQRNERITSKCKNGVVFEKSVPIRASKFGDVVLEKHKLVFI
jgi:hypothetical protein